MNHSEEEKQLKIEQLISLGANEEEARSALLGHGWIVRDAINAYVNRISSSVDENNNDKWKLNYDWDNLHISRENFKPPYDRSKDSDEDVCPPIFPMPENEEMFKKYMFEYEKDKEERRSQFLSRTIEGYSKARCMYYEALRRVFYLGIIEEEEIRKLIPFYSRGMFISHFKMFIISTRKIAECCFFLSRFEECLEICDFLIAVVDSFSKRNGLKWERVLKLVYCIKGKVCIEKREYKEASEWIRKGLEVAPFSWNLKKTLEYFQSVMTFWMHGMTRVIPESDRESVERRSPGYDRSTYRILLPKLGVVQIKKDDLLVERLDFLFKNSFISESHGLVIKFNVKLATGMIVQNFWKSLII